ncbi:MAG TPA: hypothetical protein DCP31_37505 [Cyanobacteria bacterium UBA8543]|nr:hypothetical protein [Cyanobacteria bacterium UBA8543]
MASSDDFREQLKAGNITEALALALGDAAELKITTWVASAADEGEATEVESGHRLHTSINMIDGKIENEIGEQFLGNGPYRELRQFHAEQVAQGNQIIQNNLKSLQKLFEVLVTMQHPAATTSVIESEALSVENELLPSTEEVTESEVVNSTSSSGVAELIEQDLAIAPTESTVEESALHPNTVTQEDVAPEPPAPSEEPVSFLTPTDSIKELDSDTEEEDDWDDSILDLLESLPVSPPPNTEELDSEFDEDRRNLIAETPDSDPSASDLQEAQDWDILRREDFESPSASAEPHIEAFNSQTNENLADFIPEQPEPSPIALNLPVAEDEETRKQDDFLSPLETPPPEIETLSSKHSEDWGWGDVVAEEPEFHPTASDSPVTQNQDTLNQEDFPSAKKFPEPLLETSYSQIDEEWGDMFEDEPEADSDEPFPSMDSLDLEEDEEWDEWVVEEPEPLLDEPVAELDAYALEEDEDWGDLEDDAEGFKAEINLQQSESDLEIDDDWDDLAAEIDIHTKDADLELPTSLEGTNDIQSAHHPTENNHLSKNLQTDSFTEEGLSQQLSDVSPNPVMTNQRQDSNGDRQEVLLGETEPNSTSQDENDVDITEEALLAKIAAEDFAPDASYVTFAQHRRSFKEEALAANAAPTPEESEGGVSSKDSDSQAVPKDDVDAKQKPVDRRMPPPPPPRSRFPNQNK